MNAPPPACAPAGAPQRAQPPVGAEDAGMREHRAESAPAAVTGTVLAFDFGEKRIGAAVGEPLTGIAHPLTTLHAADKARRFAAIEALIREWQPARLVVGLPTHMDGAEHALTRLARKFAADLGRRFGLPVELVDERLTSAAAESSLGEAGLDARRRKAHVDAVAAQHILQDYLDREGRRA